MAPVKTEEEKLRALGLTLPEAACRNFQDDMPRAAEKEALGFILPAIYGCESPLILRFRVWIPQRRGLP